MNRHFPPWNTCNPLSFFKIAELRFLWGIIYPKAKVLHRSSYQGNHIWWANRTEETGSLQQAHSTRYVTKSGHADGSSNVRHLTLLWLRVFVSLAPSIDLTCTLCPLGCFTLGAYLFILGYCCQTSQNAGITCQINEFKYTYCIRNGGHDLRFMWNHNFAFWYLQE